MKLDKKIKKYIQGLSEEDLESFLEGLKEKKIEDVSEVEKGDKVILLDKGCYDLHEANPEFMQYLDSEYCVGKIVDYNFLINISWGNTQNGYDLKDCILVKYEHLLVQKEPEVGLNPEELDKVVLKKDVRAEIVSVLKQHNKAQLIFEQWGLGETIEYGKGMTFLFHGPPGTGKTWATTCIAKSLSKEVISVGAQDIQTSEPGGANRAIVNAFKKAKSGKKVLFFDECDSLITIRQNVGMVIGSEINTLLTEIEKFEGILILATNRVESLDSALERRISLIVEFEEPDFTMRKNIWKKLLPEKMPLRRGITVTTLAEHKLTGGQIKNVILNAARMAASEDLRS